MLHTEKLKPGASASRAGLCDNYYYNYYYDYDYYYYFCGCFYYYYYYFYNCYCCSGCYSYNNRFSCCPPRVVNTLLV